VLPPCATSDASERVNVLTFEVSKKADSCLLEAEASPAPHGMPCVCVCARARACVRARVRVQLRFTRTVKVVCHSHSLAALSTHHSPPPEFSFLLSLSLCGRGPQAHRVYVGNLSWHVQWQVVFFEDKNLFVC